MNNRNGVYGMDVAIVGGGVAGLTAAIYLARAGRDVTVFERSRTIGGRARTQEHEGFLFNQGPHALLASEVLDELGISLSGGSPPILKTLVLKNGALHNFPLGPTGFFNTKLLSMSERIRLVALLLKVLRSDPAAAAGESVLSWVQQHTAAAPVQEMLLALMRASTYADDPADLSMEVFMQQMQLATDITYLDGGWQSLVEALEKMARSAGAKIRAESRIDGITVEGERPALQLADGRSAAASAVVLTVNPSTAHRMLPQSRVLEAVAHTARPVRMASLDVALRRLPEPSQPIVLGLDRPYYLSVHSVAADLTPPEGALIHVVSYLGKDAVGAEAETALEQVLDLAQPGWRDELIHRRFLPELIVSNYLATAPAGLSGRPDPALVDVPNVYLAGDWVGSKGWLTNASFTSARSAAHLLLRRSPRQIHSQPMFERQELQEVVI